jgi:hypothetical protein
VPAIYGVVVWGAEPEEDEEGDRTAK